MTKNEALRERTKQFAIRIIHLFRALPNATDAQIMGKQLLRCGTSVGANYRAYAGRVRSQSSSLDSVLLQKKLMKAFFGWS
jgi:four helix bundle protein